MSPRRCPRQQLMMRRLHEALQIATRLATTSGRVEAADGMEA